MFKIGCKSKKNMGNKGMWKQIFHFSLFTFHFFLYLCTQITKKQ